MTVRRRQCESDIYHVIARGVGRHTIFEDDDDRMRYCDLLATHSQGESVGVYAWCLMDNHVHLLLCARMDAISCVIMKVNSAYALYYNRRYDHVGHLFQGRFKSEPICSEEQFLTVLRYIHANPEKAGVASAFRYRWSSYSEYAGACGVCRICDTSFALRLFGTIEDFKAFHAKEGPPLPCMESDESLRTLEEDQARAIAAYAIGEESLAKLGAIPKQERDELLVQLREAGLSIRKIERLTGIGRKVIAKAKR